MSRAHPAPWGNPLLAAARVRGGAKMARRNRGHGPSGSTMTTRRREFTTKWRGTPKLAPGGQKISQDSYLP